MTATIRVRRNPAKGHACVHLREGDICEVELHVAEQLESEGFATITKRPAIQAVPETPPIAEAKSPTIIGDTMKADDKKSSQSAKSKKEK